MPVFQIIHPIALHAGAISYYGAAVKDSPSTAFIIHIEIHIVRRGRVMVIYSRQV